MQTVNKKISLFLIFVMMFLFLPCHSIAKAAMPGLIKVGLFYGSGAKNSYTLSAPGGMAAFLASDNNSVRLFSDYSLTSSTIKKNVYCATECTDVFNDFASAEAKVAALRNQGFDAYCAVTGAFYTVRIGTFATFEEAQSYANSIGTYPIYNTSTGVLILKGDNIKLAVDDLAWNLEIVPLSGNLTINSKAYRGSIRFLRRSGNDMAAINILPVEEYLYSVVSKEVSPSWHPEALKAQAVAARTFTITNFNKFSNYGFNLDNTTVSQVYGGVNAEDYRTTNAVNATAGEIVKYNGEPASTYYFSSSGGRTANSEDVWSSALPYLRSVDDPYENPQESTYSRWTVTYTKQQIKDLLSNKGVNIGNINDITAEYTPSGYVAKITIFGSSGTKSYSKDNIRSALSLKSTNFRLIKDGSDSEVYVTSASQTPFLTYLNESLFVLSKDGTNVLGSSPAILGASGLHTPTSGASSESFTFSGGGWGHGIGMSQWGAKGMADNGFTYKQILTHYYTGVQVEQY